MTRGLTRTWRHTLGGGRRTRGSLRSLRLRQSGIRSPSHDVIRGCRLGGSSRRTSCDHGQRTKHSSRGVLERGRGDDIFTSYFRNLENALVPSPYPCCASPMGGRRQERGGNHVIAGETAELVAPSSVGWTPIAVRPVAMSMWLAVVQTGRYDRNRLTMVQSSCSRSGRC